MSGNLPPPIHDNHVHQILTANELDDLAAERP